MFFNVHLTIIIRIDIIRNMESMRELHLLTFIKNVCINKGYTSKGGSLFFSMKLLNLYGFI